ncbi:MAG: nitrous oxide-stimulated promoter family protein [Epsilonproteobacteria bacterium]|nr:nitrous oxide-stimulated promoter family protein [Campylobacterota bacterium]
MTLDKYTTEVEILKNYFPYYCKHHHSNQIDKEFLHSYKDKDFSIKVSLCDECFDAMQYSIQRLQNCQYEEKPRCRTCKTPCYEKSYWKKLAKVMIYSSLRLKLTHFVSKLKFK